MTTYPLPDLLRLWRKGELTAEQAMGYLLQNLVAVVQQQADHEKRLRQLEQASAKPPA